MHDFAQNKFTDEDWRDPTAEECWERSNFKQRTFRRHNLKEWEVYTNTPTQKRTILEVIRFLLYSLFWITSAGWIISSIL